MSGAQIDRRAPLSFARSHVLARFCGNRNYTTRTGGKRLTNRLAGL